MAYLYGIVCLQTYALCIRMLHKNKRFLLNSKLNSFKKRKITTFSMIACFRHTENWKLQITLYCTSWIQGKAKKFVGLLSQNVSICLKHCRVNFPMVYHEKTLELWILKGLCDTFYFIIFYWTSTDNGKGMSLDLDVKKEKKGIE